MTIGTTLRKALFHPGVIVVTTGAARAICQDDVLDALVRHFSGDWGDLDEHDRTMNDEAVECGGRILSQYASREAKAFWIVTEADRSATTILLPEEY